MSEINVTTLEHRRQLGNHLGPESRIQAENIRATNSRNAERAVKNIWDHLHCEYGSEEIKNVALATLKKFSGSYIW